MLYMFTLLEKSIEAGKVDTVRVITKQAQDEQEQVLMKLLDQKKEIEDKIEDETNCLHLISHNCEGDIHSIGQYENQTDKYNN